MPLRMILGLAMLIGGALVAFSGLRGTNATVIGLGMILLGAMLFASRRDRSQPKGSKARRP